MKFNFQNIKLFLKILIICFIFYYIILPPINLTSPLFWGYLGLMLVINTTYYEVKNIIKRKNIITNKPQKNIRIIFSIPIIIFFLIGIINFVLSPFFISKTYANRITINKESNFIDDIKEVDFNKLPLLDKDSSQKLGDRVMGQMTDLVSQYHVSNLYTQINYNDEIIRVTPLEYANFIKFFTNNSRGVEGYITVNSVTGKANLIRLKNGMKYMPSALFSKDLNRKLRFDYPTEIFDKPAFEIDNDGNPYWIIPIVKYHGIGIRKEITGIVILNPITGESKKYKNNEIPSWVDHVYPADLIIEQVNDWGKYQNGFLNSIFAQKGVVATTEGYNYTVMDDDVYLYTGITSVATDESNIGFIMCNLRTKETKFYEVSGAEEYSAMASAEGQVQQMKYKATFPLLINLKGKPTYLMSLKDNAGLVKMYAFVDVEDYQKVTVTDAKEGIIKAAANYLGTDEINNNIDFENIEITINSIKEVIIDGNTYYYITDTKNNKYRASIKVSPDILPFIKENDKVIVDYNKSSINEIKSLKNKE